MVAWIPALLQFDPPLTNVKMNRKRSPVAKAATADVGQLQVKSVTVLVFLGKIVVPGVPRDVNVSDAKCHQRSSPLTVQSFEALVFQPWMLATVVPAPSDCVLANVSLHQGY
jgi:hypothetical protein